MQRNLLTLMFVVSFLFVGASVIRAEVPTLSRSSVKQSKDYSAKVINQKIGTIMKMRCNSISADCAQLLAVLQTANTAWETCIANNPGHCGNAEAALIEAGDNYNNAGCVPENSKYIERKKLMRSEDKNG